MRVPAIYASSAGERLAGTQAPDHDDSARVNIKDDWH
jgi:hypothetical protein